MHQGVETIGQPVHQVGQANGVYGFVYLRCAGTGFGEGDVVPDGAGEQERFLRHDAQLTAQRAQA